MRLPLLDAARFAATALPATGLTWAWAVFAPAALAPCAAPAWASCRWVAALPCASRVRPFALARRPAWWRELRRDAAATLPRDPGAATIGAVSDCAFLVLAPPWNGPLSLLK